MFEGLVLVTAVVIVEQLRYPVPLTSTPHVGLFLFSYDNDRLADRPVCLMNVLNMEILSNEKNETQAC